MEGENETFDPNVHSDKLELEPLIYNEIDMMIETERQKQKLSDVTELDKYIENIQKQEITSKHEREGNYDQNITIENKEGEMLFTVDCIGDNYNYPADPELLNEENILRKV